MRRYSPLLLLTLLLVLFAVPTVAQAAPSASLALVKGPTIPHLANRDANFEEAEEFEGEEIEIELRDATELLGTAGRRTVVEGALAWNPVFDVTPAELIDAIVTERGVIERPGTLAMQAMFGS